MNPRLSRIPIFCMLAAIASTSTFAQTTVIVSEQSTAGGSAQAGSFTLIATVGQPAPLGQASAGQFTLFSGYINTLDLPTGNQAPTFSNVNATPTSPTAGQAVLVSATIIDDALGTTAALNYRRGGEAGFTTLAMASSGSSYSASIPGGTVTSRGVEYFLTATDANNATTRSPTIGVFSIQVRIASETKPTAQPSGTAQNAYRLISVPFDLDNENPLSVLQDELGDYDNTKWRLFGTPNAQPPFYQGKEYPDAGNFSPGRSLFLIVASGAPQISAGPGASVSTAGSFSITLNPGHNFIGSPFNFNLHASKLSISGAPVTLRRYGSSGWVTVDSLIRWEGYYIGNQTQQTLLINPSVSSSAAASPANRIYESEWRLQISARCGVANDLENFAGVAHAGENGWDEYDLVEPPPIGEYVSLYFSHPEWQKVLSRYSDDVRSSNDENQRWDFVVESALAGETVDLYFDNIQKLDGEMSVFLVDGDLDYKQNLRERATYQFQSRGLEHPKKLTLVVGKQEYIADATEGFGGVPEDYVLYQNFPNPFNPETAIRFGLPEKSAVTLKIFDLNGREVMALVENERLEAGPHQRYWDGRDVVGRPVASGIYFYQLIAASFSRTMKMALVK